MLDPKLAGKLREISERNRRTAAENRRQREGREHRLEAHLQRLRQLHDLQNRVARDHAIRTELLQRLCRRGLFERVQSWWGGGP